MENEKITWSKELWPLIQEDLIKRLGAVEYLEWTKKIKKEIQEEDE